MATRITRFSTQSAYNTYINGNNKLLPNVSTCEDNKETYYKPKYDYSQDYLTFIAKENTTFTFTPTNNNIISYSTNDGETWIEGNIISVNNGDKVLWKGTMTPYAASGAGSKGIGKFSSTGNFDVRGNIMSLLYGDNYNGQTDLTGKNYALSNLFNNNVKIINAKDLSLPATTLSPNCYYYMFNYCTSLVTAPKLPALQLASYCYYNMFGGCTHLVKAPQLPATTLEQACYDDMFNGCTNLTEAPELPAATLVKYCYRTMFSGCSNLNYIKAMFTTTPSGSSPNYYTRNWVSGVASSGTFVKNSKATWTTTGNNGIPTGWTVETASE